MRTTLIAAIPDERTKARLEFSCFNTAPGEQTVRYELVLPLDDVDCRGTFDHKPSKISVKNFSRVQLSKDNCKRIPLGVCVIGTSNQLYPFSEWDSTHIKLPFRDGAHAQWDQEKLGLEIYYRTTTGIYHLAMEPQQPAPAAKEI